MDDKPLGTMGPRFLTQPPINDHLTGEKLKANLAHESSHRLEILKSVVAAGDSGLKTLLVINGGACVALLAFLGNLLTKETIGGVHFSFVNIKAGMLRFTAGVALVGVGVMFRYSSLYAAMLRHRYEVTLSLAALLAGLGSLFAFVLGCLWVVGAVW